MVTIEPRGSPPPIRAILLGDVRITVGHRAITEDAWSRRSARSLLLLLLITRGHALPRDRVLDILWPGASPEHARKALAKTLHLLRRVLEPELSKGRESSYVDSRGGAIGLMPDVDIWVDADACETGLSQAALAEAAEHRSQLRNAVALYGGELLATDPYEDWPVARREALQRTWEGAVLKLAALDLAAGEPHGSVAFLESLLADDPTTEAAHRALMRAYAASGQRDRALRQYARCRSALEEELGSEPELETAQLYAAIQAAAPNLAEQPPVVSTRINNLPVPPTSIVGRDRESEAVQGLLWRQDVRLVTLTGPGGVGKTRLAIDAAAALIEDFADGIAFVSLATVLDPSLVLPAIARTLGVTEEPGQPLAVTLESYLQERELLLVLDNFEQVLNAATGIGALLSSCASLTVLVTSRERLQLRGEHVHEVPPLMVPQQDRLPAPAMLARYGSVALFRQHLRLLHPEFDITPMNSEAISAICIQLEGLPLAIELAAARARFLGLPDLLKGSVNRLDLLRDGPRDLPARQRTLRDTIAWSHNLLTTEEQAVFRRLGVFVGGWAPAAASAVCDTPGEATSALTDRLHSLAEKHLVGWDVTGDTPRLTMLETIREFAVERLVETGEEPEARQRHAGYYLDLATQAEQGLVGTDQLAWIKRLEIEQGNIGGALGWALEQPGEVGTLAVRAAAALWRFWWTQGRLSEGISWLQRAAARPGTEPTLRARALLAMAELFDSQSDYTRAAAALNEALPISRAAGDAVGVAKSLSGLGQIAQDQGRYDEATSLHHEALTLYRDAGHRRDSAGSLNNLATVAYYRGDVGRATELWEEALAIVRVLRDDWAAGLVLGNLGAAAMTRREFDTAATLFQENLSVARLQKDPGAIGRALSNLSEALEMRGDGDQDALLAEALAHLQTAEDRQGEVSALTFMGNGALRRGEIHRAASLYAESLSLCQSIGDRTTIAATALLERIATLAHVSAQPRQAALLLGASEALREQLGAPLMPHLRPIQDDCVSRITATLGSEAATEALTIGRAIDPDGAIAAALAICRHAEALAEDTSGTDSSAPLITTRTSRTNRC